MPLKAEGSACTGAGGGLPSRLLNFTPKYVAESVQLLITAPGFCTKREKKEEKQRIKSKCTEAAVEAKCLYPLYL